MSSDTYISKFPSPLNCAINEQTGDGITVGRCWAFVSDNDQCPRHGDVSEVMERYRRTGKLTKESDFKKPGQ